MVTVQAGVVRADCPVGGWVGLCGVRVFELGARNGSFLTDGPSPGLPQLRASGGRFRRN